MATDRRPRFIGSSFMQILDLNRGVGLGFDLLRLGLALSVLVAHTSGLVGHSGTTAWVTHILHELGLPLADATAAAPAPPIEPLAARVGIPAAPVGSDPAAPGMNGISGPLIRAIVPMFFALSGFLVTGSAMRTRGLSRFLGLRALRILPALLVEVVLSAVVLGAIFTALPLGAYYLHPEFRRYFLNILGIVQFRLPGVSFPSSGNPVVNANLWTIPFELECYLLMSAFIVLGLLQRRLVLTLLFAAATIGLIVLNAGYGYSADVGVFNGRSLVFCFAVGVLFYVWRDRIPFHPVLFVLAGVAAYVLLRIPHATFISPFFLTYVTVFIGLMPLPQVKLVKSGDYSYGIYLYGFPVTQALIAIIGRDALPFPLFLLLAVVATSLFAALSWHGVEKHVLKLKRFLSRPSARVTASLHPDAMPREAPAAS